jgi:hypothetical protein
MSFRCQGVLDQAEDVDSFELEFAHGFVPCLPQALLWVTPALRNCAG